MPPVAGTIVGCEPAAIRSITRMTEGRSLHSRRTVSMQMRIGCGWLRNAIISTMGSSSIGVESTMDVPTILSLKVRRPFVIDPGFNGDVLIRSGTVAMTSPLPKSKVILRAGERHQVPSAVGVVLEAVRTGARVALLPAMSPCSWLSPLRALMEGSIR